MIRRLSELTDDEIEALCAEAAIKGLGFLGFVDFRALGSGSRARLEDFGIWV